MSKFCPECGFKKEAGVESKFCSNCGFKFVSNEIKTASPFLKEQIRPILESPIGAPIQKEKKTRTWIYWVLGIILFFGSFILYDYITYPKNEKELRNLYCDKYWKVSSFEVEKIYVNDTLIPKSGGNLGNIIRSIVDNRSQMYEYYQKKLEKKYSYDNFFIIHFNKSQKKYFQFNLSYNLENREYVYNSNNPTLNQIGAKFTYQYDTEFMNYYSLVTNKNIVDSENQTIKKIDKKIISITSDSVIVLKDYTIIDNDTKKEFRVVLKIEYAITKPNAKYLDVLNIQKLLLWDTPKPDYSDSDI